jgi:hypothetical protein
MSPPSRKLKDCPDDFKEMCRALNKWGEEWEKWGLRVKAKVDVCCPGDPAPLPSPPKPPF